MIHGLIFIIKLIGWILLGILGLILGIVLVVLFSAVRYQVDGRKQEKINGKIRITWLLWILSVTACYEEQFQATVKLFGWTIWKLGGTEGKKEEELYPAEDIPDLEEPSWWEPEDKEEADSKTPVWEEQKEEEIKPENQANQENPKEKKKKKRKPKLRFSFEEICGKLKQIQDKFYQIKEKWDKVLEYLENPRNQKSARLIIRQGKKMVLYLLPRKGSISLTFGREDPYLMGKILTYASFLYPFTHKVITVHPVFGENILEGEVHIGGHIRLGMLLGMALRLLFDRNIRRQLWQFIRPKKKKQKRNKVR